MSILNIPFSIYIYIYIKRKSPLIIPSLQLWGFIPKGLKNVFETAVVNEPSEFEALKVYCNSLLSDLKFET